MLLALQWFGVLANPVVESEAYISEIYFDDSDNWTIEIYCYYINPDYNEFKLYTSSGFAYFSLDGDIALITAQDLSTPLSINREGDFIYITQFDDMVMLSDTVSFGNYPGSKVNATLPGESLVNVIVEDNGYSIYNHYWLVKDIAPSLGYISEPVKETFSGYLLDINGDPVKNIEIEYGATGDLPLIWTNEVGYFECDSMYCRNYSIMLGGTYLLDDLTVEPGSSVFRNYQFNNPGTVEISGYCHLNGTGSEEGTKIYLRNNCPGFVVDSTVTDESGFYSLNVSIGDYSVIFDHTGYYPFYSFDGNTFLENSVLYSEYLDFGNVTTIIGGNQQGVWDNIHTYLILGDVIVPENDSLILKSWTQLEFVENSTMFVYGTLFINGTENDSVEIYKSYIQSWNSYKNAINFMGSGTANSQIQYARFEGNGSGITLYDASFPVNNSMFYDNKWPILLYGTSAPLIDSVTFEMNNKSLLCFDQSSPVITHCMFFNNSRALQITDNSSPAIYNNIFYYNNVSINLMGNCSPEIFNNTLFSNGMAFRILYDVNPIVSSNIVVNNNTGMIFGNYYGGGGSFNYNDFWGNNSDFEIGGTQYPPDGLGLLTATNINGDSCDTYYNIFLYPQFSDTATADFHLTEFSPCIDAGNPEFSLDPDSTIADIGAYYYYHNPVFIKGNGFNPVKKFAVYPNPANSEIFATFELKQDDADIVAGLKILDIKGKEVASVHFNGTNSLYLNITEKEIPAGTYLFILEFSGEKVAVEKVILQK